MNAEIEKLGRSLASISDETFHIVCECGDLACFQLIALAIVDCERIRADDTLFLVNPGHHRAKLHDVVERTARYHVVRKRVREPVPIDDHRKKDEVVSLS